MPNRYAAGTTQLLVRLPEDTKRKLYAEVERLNTANPGAQYSANSVVRTLIDGFVTGKIKLL